MRGTLYGMSSPNVLKIVIMLEELGGEYAFQHVNLFSGEAQGADALALNPNRKVPIWVPSDEQPIIESGAILLHLAEETLQFLPATGQERSAVLQWLFLQVSTVGPLLGQLNHFTTYAPPGEDYALGRYRREAHRIYTMLDTRLSECTVLAGGDYSIADIATLPWTDYIESQGLDSAAYPALMRWRAQMNARPAVNRARAFIAEVQSQDRAMFEAAPESERRRFAGQEPNRL